MPNLDTEIRARLAEYLAGEITLRQFRTWFVPAAWNIDRQEGAAADLAGEIGLRIAEYTSGHRDEAELRRLLAPLVQHYTILVREQPVFGTSSTTERSSLTYPAIAVGRRPAVTSV